MVQRLLCQQLSSQAVQSETLWSSAKGSRPTTPDTGFSSPHLHAVVLLRNRPLPAFLVIHCAGDCLSFPLLRLIIAEGVQFAWGQRHTTFCETKCIEKSCINIFFSHKEPSSLFITNVSYFYPVCGVCAPFMLEVKS